MPRNIAHLHRGARAGAYTTTPNSADASYAAAPRALLFARLHISMTHCAFAGGAL